MTSNEITGLDMSGSITYGTIENLTVGLGSANDVFSVLSTFSSTETWVNGGAGTDAINVGSAEPTAGGNDTDIETLNDISGLLHIDGQDGADKLYVFDGDDGKRNRGILTSSYITGLDMGGREPHSKTITLRLVSEQRY